MLTKPSPMRQHQARYLSYYIHSKWMEPSECPVGGYTQPAVHLTNLAATGEHHLPLTVLLMRCLGSGGCPLVWGCCLRPLSDPHSVPAPISAELPQTAPCLRTRERRKAQVPQARPKGMNMGHRGPQQGQNWAGPYSWVLPSSRSASVQAVI